MEIIAVSKSVRISPRKVRLVADGIRNLPLEKALNVLSMTQKRGSSVLSNVIKSAIANAINNFKKNKELLFIKRIEVGDGPAIKRYHPSTRGRIHPYKKRSSNIKIILADDRNERLQMRDEKVKKGEKHGTKS